MSDRISFGKWFTEQLTDKNNPYSANYVFANEDEVFKYFRAEDYQTLSFNITRQYTKKETREMDKCFKDLNLDLEELACSVMALYKDKPVTTELIDTICSIIVRSNPDSSILLPIFAQASFIYQPCNNSYDGIFLSGYKDKNVAINKYFGGEIIKGSPYDLIEELAHFCDEQFVKYHFESILKRMLSENKYIFDKRHIQIMLEQNIWLEECYSSTFLDKAPTESINKFLEGILAIHHENEIDAQTIKRLIAPPYKSYGDLLRNHSALSESKQVQAAFSLEQLNIGGESVYTKEITMWDTINGNEAPSPLPINNFRHIYPDKDWVPILAHIVSYIAERPTYSNSTAIDICKQIIEHNTPYKDVFVDILDYIKYENKELPLSEVKCKGIGFALMLSGIKIPSLAIFEYGIGESEAWYDNYQTTLYDQFNLAPKNSLTELYSKQLNDFVEVLHAANQAGAHYVVLSQALSIQEKIKSWFVHQPLIDIFISSLSQINLEELKSFSLEIQKAILFIALKYDAPLSEKLLDHITISTLNGKSSSEITGEDFLNKKISANIDTLNKILNDNLENLPTELINIQTGMIGRAKKEITHQDGLVVILLMLGIKNSLISFDSIRHDIPDKINESINNDEPYYYRRSSKEIFTNKHFPRLKNGDAFHRINCLVKYLSSTELLSKILSEEYSIEGRFKDGDTLYVFGEFSWTSLVYNFDDSIKEIKFLYLSFDKEDKEYISELALNINKESNTLLSFLMESFDKNEAKMNNMFNRKQEHNGLDNCKRHYLPDVEFQGVNLKNSAS